MLPHPAKALRQTAGTVLSVVVAEDGLGRWPDLVVALAQCLASADVNAVDGALDALYKVRKLETNRQRAADRTPRRPSFRGVLLLIF